MVLGYTGLYTVRLGMPWVQSLKEKRALVRPVVERLKARFPVSVARLAGLNDHDFEVIGVVSHGEYDIEAEDTHITAIEHEL
jgi:uncharacterized protein